MSVKDVSFKSVTANSRRVAIYKLSEQANFAVTHGAIWRRYHRQTIPAFAAKQLRPL
jgi:hypothetical protein